MVSEFPVIWVFFRYTNPFLFSGYGTFFTYGAFCLSMFVFVWFLVPETKGLSLERMDDLFGVTGGKEKDLFDADPEARSSDADRKDATVVHEEKVR